MLLHAPTKSVILNAPDPFYLRELLPRSRLINHPDYNIAIKHTLASTKVLRNVGFEVPAPIESQYHWPGKYQPFAHQRVMADFMTTHQRCFNLSEMGCVSADTEYLTPTGWRRIDQYDGGAVAQYWPETGNVDFVEAPEYVKLPCDTMIRLKTKYGLDQMLSIEHRVLLQAYANPDKREVVQAADLLQRQDAWLRGVSEPRDARISWSQSTIPTSFHGAGGAGLPLSDAQLRLQVAVIADGYFGKATSWCTMHLKKARKKKRLRNLLTEAGVDHRETESATVPGFTVFRFNAPWRLKLFDARFWEATPGQLRTIVDEVMYWDGSRKPYKSPQFSTCVEASADFIQYAASATGSTARKTSQTRHRRGNLETEYVITVRHGVDRLMLKSVSSRGIKHPVMSIVPSPDGYKYCFMVPSTFLVLRRNGCIFLSGNTGKTASCLWAADWLMNTGYVQKALILSPLSTLERVWRNDIFDVLMHRSATLVHGTREKRKAALEADVDFYVMNHDGVSIAEINRMVLTRPDINLVIVDEGSMFRNHDTKKYKALKKILRDDMRLWWLTGTPCPNAPTDAWAQARLVNPGGVPQFFGSFKRQTMLQVSQFKWVPKQDAYSVAFKAMQPAVRFKKADCLDLPPVTTQDRQAGLTKEQKDAVASMLTVMQAEAKTTKITAVNAADKINKLRQILCGVVKDPASGDYLPLAHKPRTEVLLESIESASAKVLVVVPFKGIIQSLSDEVGEHYSCAVLNGDVPPRRRDQIILDFKTQTNPHVLLCHPKVMAHGLNLTEADTLIFYAPIYSNDEFQQVVERFNRTGQTRKMTITRIAAHPLEWEIYKMVDNRKVTQDSILSLYQSIAG